MPLGKTILTAAAAGMLFIVGCEGTAPSKRVSSAEGRLLVSNNLVGEECSVDAAVEEHLVDRVDESYHVYCGSWEHVTARIYRVAMGAGGVTKWTSPVNWWRQLLEQRATCDSPREETLLGNETGFFIPCRLRNGGWPFSALIVGVGDYVYLSDGIPAAMSVVEETIGWVSGHGSADHQDFRRGRNTPANKWRQRIAEESYGSSDLDAYYRLMLSGQYYDSVDQFAEAEKRFRKALLWQEKLLGVDNPEILDPLMHLAVQLSNQERFDEADVLFNRVRKGLANVDDAAEESRYLSYRGIHEANQRRYGHAMAIVQRATDARLDALRATAAAGQGTNDASVSSAELAQGLYLEAAMLQRLGDTKAASDRLETAEASVKGESRIPPTWIPRMLQLEAELVDQSGSGGSPISILQGARDLLVTEVPDERPTFLAHLNLGRKYFESGQLDRALDSYGAGLRLLRKQNGYLHFNQVRPFFDLILAVVDQNPDQRQELFELAFDAAQFIKTKRTVADIARVSARLSVGDSKVAEAIRALQDAEDRRNLLFQEYEAELGRVFDDRDKGRLAELRERIEATEQQVVELGEAAQAANPRYRLLVGTPAKANDVVATLRPREALIQVLLGEPSSYLLMVRNGEISLRLLDSSSSQVRRDVATLRDSLAPKLSATGGLYVSDFDMGTAHGLYQSLFGGIESELSGVEHLIVVPNESLLSMPFGLLVTDQLLEKRNYAKAAWLINKFAISVVPSARSLVDLRATARASTASKDFIGFADFMPVDHQSASQIRPPLSAECRAVPRHVDDFRRQLSEFPALSGTRKQVESIAENYPQDSVKLVLGQQFTDVSLQSAPLSDQLADYRIVHFATHGLLPSEINCKSEPALATSYAVSAGEDSDGLLDVTEIDRLKLDAELVVLSACNTAGEGGMEGGQALSGLARAFFYAGARSIIASHWSVLEDPTTDLMVSIFNRRRQRDGTIGWSEALRRGQMEAIESAKRTGRAHLAHPYFWGAFVVVGDGAQSEIPNLLAQGYF